MNLDLHDVPIDDPTLVWKPMPGPADHPEARAFQAAQGPWRFIIIGAPPEADGRTPIGGTAFDVERGVVIVLPLSVAHQAWTKAMEGVKYE